MTETKKTFVVVYRITGRASVTVEAENEADARKLAMQSDSPMELEDWQAEDIVDVYGI